MKIAPNIMVYRTGHLGDTICAVPSFRLIRENFPEARLTLLCDRPSDSKVAATEVMRRVGPFDEILSYSSGGIFGLLELIRHVVRARPSEVILLPQARETASRVHSKLRFFRLFGVKSVRGLQLPRSAREWQPSEPTRLVHILQELGLRGDKPKYAIPTDQVAQSTVTEKLNAINVSVDKPFLVFCGGGKVATQRWPLDRYRLVLRNVADKLGWPVVGLGTPDEVELYRGAGLPRYSALRLLQDGLSVSEMFELFRFATAYVGNDTGPMHVAASVSCPVAGIISARNAPGMWDPDVEPRLIIRRRMNCEDCFLNDCVTERHRCLTEITAEDVLSELIPFLQSLTCYRKGH